MTVPAQGSIFSFGIQAAKVGKGGTFDQSLLTWYKMRAIAFNVGPLQDQQNFPLETGGPLTPSGSYKQAAFGAGEADFIPRLQNITGFLLKAVMGTASTMLNKDSDGNTVSGLNTHIFRFNPSLPADQPWIAARRVIPGAVTAENSGEIIYDCKITSLRLTAPAMGKVSANISMFGRDFQFADPTAWVYGNANFEDTAGTPDSGRGYFKIDGTEYPAMGLSIEINNGLTNPQQETVIGSFNPDDIIALTRQGQFRFVYKYKNDDLHRQIFTGTANGTQWSSLPFIKATGGNYALDIKFQAPLDVGVTGHPYTLRVIANRVTLSEGPIQLQAGGIISQTVIVTALDPGSSYDYIDLILENDATGY